MQLFKTGFACGCAVTVKRLVLVEVFVSYFHYQTESCPSLSFGKNQVNCAILDNRLTH